MRDKQRIPKLEGYWSWWTIDRKEKRRDKYAPGVISVVTCWVSDWQSHVSSQPWVFILSLLSNLNNSVFFVPKACVVLSVHICVHMHVCVLGKDICVCMLREWRGTYSVCMWSLNCLCIKSCGFTMANTLILKSMLNIKLVLNIWLENQKSLEPLEIPNNYVSHGASLGSFIG